MGATGYLIAGGLLQGVGTAITKNAEQRRQDALLALQREYQVEDRNYNAAAKIADTKEQGNQRVREIQVTAEGNQATERVKAAADAANIVLKGNIDVAHDTQIEKLRQSGKLTEDAYQSGLDTQKELKIAGVTADHWAVTKDGQLVAFNKKGEILKYSTGSQTYPVPGEQPDDSLGGGSISGAREARGGSSAAPASPAPKKEASPGSAKIKADALAQLGTVYAKIASDPAQAAEYRRQYPGMFDASGKLLPRQVLIQRVNQRYGG